MDFINEFYLIVEALKENIGFALLCVSVLWVIHFANRMLGYRLNALGIYPRHIGGLLGIFFAPFLHGNFEHLLLNSIPAVILIDLVSIYGKYTLFTLTIFIIVTSGVGVWLVGRKALHVGASGLMMGYWGFLIVSSYQQNSAMTIILAIICLYYLGNMALSLLPVEKGASWEGHLLGCLSGAMYPFALPYLIPWFSFF